MNSGKTFFQKGVKRLLLKRDASGDDGPELWCCFTFVNGKIAPPLSCELNTVDHCNLTCLDCNHASPSVRPGYADPNDVFKDFSTLAAFYQARIVKIIGGEPLLHPDLLSLIKAVRKSKIGEKILLVTNGTLLHKMPAAVWEAIDQLEISLYPEVRLTEGMLQEFKRKAAKNNIHLVRHAYQTFRITFSTVGTSDDNLVHRIYRTCKLARLWGCQSIHRGYFFKCPQCIYIPSIIEPSLAYSHTDDGVQISASHNLRDSLIAYLSSKTPLKACRYCLGVVGKERKHQLVKRGAWKTAHEKRTEDLIDYEKLERIESGFKTPDVKKILL
jgi:cyclic pyranopterin phosphate synthase